MKYEGNIFRPPSEAYSLIVQVTIGCSHNKCTFCSMFKDKDFRIRQISEVLEDLKDARQSYRRIDKIFLADGDALCLANSKLLLPYQSYHRLLLSYQAPPLPPVLG